MLLKYVPIIVKFHKTISIFYDYFTKSSITFEEPFKVPLPAIAGDITDVNSLSAWHFANLQL